MLLKITKSASFGTTSNVAVRPDAVDVAFVFSVSDVLDWIDWTKNSVLPIRSESPTCSCRLVASGYVA